MSPIQFIDRTTDAWHTVDADAPSAQSTPHSLLTSAQWTSLRDRWPAEMPVGVQVANDTDIETLEADLPRIALVVLHFPKWTDGRAYSQAHLLRSRFRFSGQVRATGDVLVDMLPLLARTGFDAVCLAPGQKLDAARRALRFFASYYQGDVAETRPHFARAAV